MSRHFMEIVVITGTFHDQDALEWVLGNQDNIRKFQLIGISSPIFF